MVGLGWGRNQMATGMRTGMGIGMGMGMGIGVGMGMRMGMRMGMGMGMSKFRSQVAPVSLSTAPTHHSFRTLCLVGISGSQSAWSDFGGRGGCLRCSIGGC